MCGITGGVWTRPECEISREQLQRMTEAIVHRGPDEEGLHTAELHHQPPYPQTPGVALGFRRLSIIDVAGSHQPLSNEDGSIQMVFNGEIYNYTDLRRRLQGAGHKFRTTGDGESIVHLYEDEGIGFLDHLVGMFAIAIWDSRHRKLILARDRLGQKPLVYRHEPGRLLFASELKSLLAAPNVPRDLDLGAVDEYLAYKYVPHPNTIFRGICKLPPGHAAVFEDERLTVTRYWQPDLNEEVPADLPAHCEEVRHLLTESVRLRLQSDVPLGAFLSGGIDSSIVVALAQQTSQQPVKTFSIGFPIEKYDETGPARRVAAHLGTDHQEFQVEPSCVDVLPKLVWFYDEPFADASAIPTYYLAKLTREHVTVAVSGDGGDELYAGYDRYQAVRLADRFDRLPGLVRRFLAARIWQRLPAGSSQNNRRRQFKRFVALLAQSPARRYAEWVAAFNQQRRGEMYEEAFIRQLPDSDPAEFVLAALARSSGRDPVTSATLCDIQTYLPCDLNYKVDIASMAHSLECRQPMLDHRVVEHAMRLPLSEKLRGRSGKRILQYAFGDLLPPEVFSRKKMGFGVPLDDWFRNELREMLRDVLLDTTATSRGMFRTDVVESMITQHESQQFNHGYRLWSLMILELWLREWID